MKKFLFFAALLAISLVAKAECGDGPYGLQINGSTVVDAPKFGDPDAQGRVQYKASCVELQAGDVVKLINQSCGDTWMVDIDPYGAYQSFEGGKDAGKLTCKTAGKFDFYIKLSMEAGDLIYIGGAESCGDGTLKAAEPPAAVDGHIHGQQTGGALGQHGDVRHLAFRNPAATAHRALYQGNHGVASAYREGSDACENGEYLPKTRLLFHS